MRHNNISLKNYGRGAPPLTTGGAVQNSDIPSNTPVGIISPPPILVSEGGHVRENYKRIIEKNSHHDPMGIKNSDILSKISFGKKNSAKHDNIKFVF